MSSEARTAILAAADIPGESGKREQLVPVRFAKTISIQPHIRATIRVL